MSVIMTIGVAATIILLLAASYFYAKGMEQDAAQDDFEHLRNSFRAIGHLAQKHKDGSITTADLEAEIDRDAAYTDKLRGLYGSASRKNCRISWIVGLIAFFTILLSILLESYLDYAVQEAYHRGVLESVQKGVQP